MIRVYKYLFALALCFISLFIYGCKKNTTEPQPSPPLIPFEEHPVDLNFAGIHCIHIIDLDRDGDRDVVGGSETTPYSQSRGIAWWRNDGGNPPVWTRFPVDFQFDHVMSVTVYDIDGDAYPDIIATSWDLHQIAWWKNSGDPTSNWIKHTIRSNFSNAHDAKCFDMNGDGHMDVSGISSSGEVVLCINDGSHPPVWEHQILTSSFGGGKSLLIQDMDEDGDPDLLGTAADADRITWWENQGGNPITWASHPVDRQFIGSTGIDVINMNEDGLYDIIATSWKSDQVCYWICQDLKNDLWEKTIVTSQLGTAVSARGCDFDMDGDVDIVAVGKSPGELVIFINEHFSWTKQPIKTDFNGGSALAIGDLDDDGDMDIISGASVLGKLYWWENILIK